MAEPRNFETSDVGALTRELLSIWRDLEPYVSDRAGARLSGAERLVVERWRMLFEPEIFYVQSSRNLVAHSPETLAETQLRGAVMAASKLRELLFSGLENPAAVLGAEVASAL